MKRYLPQKIARSLLVAAGLLAGVTATQAASVTVTADIGDGVTPTAVTWYATNEYLLNTVVYVQSNAVLTIEPGTVVKGGTNAANLITRTGLPNAVSALWVTRGGQLYATGTLTAPIIFTMEGDDVNDPNDIPPTVTGQWGGVVLMGNARVNSAQYGPGDTAPVVFDRYEGVTDNGPKGEHLFGGTDDGDSSGALRYVSIRHTGNIFATDKELNALTMGGVGSNTVVEYVEAFAGSDDGFEWWGGCVNTRYLVAAFMEDDDFDTDQGYRGTNQFWFGIKGLGNASGDSRGMESDGDILPSPGNAQAGPHGDRLPWTQWAVYNATLIGRGTNDTDSTRRVAWNPRDETAASVYNSVFAEWNRGIKLDSDGMHFYATNVQADVRNNVWDVTTSGDGSNSDFLFSDASRSNQVTAALLGGISYTNDVAGLDPRPQTGSPALTNTLAGAPTPVSYRGAFAPNDNWADGWSFLSTAGYLKPTVAVPNPVTLTIMPNSANVDISFTSQAGFSYTLESTGTLSPAGWGTATGVTPANPQTGTGGTLTFTVPAADAEKFFQVKAN